MDQANGNNDNHGGVVLEFNQSPLASCRYSNIRGMALIVKPVIKCTFPPTIASLLLLIDHPMILSSPVIFFEENPTVLTVFPILTLTQLTSTNILDNCINLRSAPIHASYLYSGGERLHARLTCKKSEQSGIPCVGACPDELSFSLTCLSDRPSSKGFSACAAASLASVTYSVGCWETFAARLHASKRRLTSSFGGRISRITRNQRVLS